MCFLEKSLFHPAACLLVWLTFAVVVQFYGWTALALVVAVFLILGQKALARWFRQLRRAKWLFLSLWIILAYGVPGELWQGLAWAPTIEGMEAASLHALRLIVLLGSIAWLFEALPHEDFIAGLWQLMQPLRVFGWNAESSVARLALVFDYLENAPPRGSWRHFLDLPPKQGKTLEILEIHVAHWRQRDAGLLLLALLLPCLIWVP